jgi:membrane protein DedA with SNARE-associated domain
MGRYWRMAPDLMALVDALVRSPLLYPLLVGLCSLDGVLPMIPSEPAVLAAGVFSHAGTPTFLLVVVASALGVFIGDHLAYGLSRSVLGPRLISRSKHVSRAVAAAGPQLDRRAGLLIVISRFLPGGRVTMNLACGTAGLPLSRFSPASAIAALAWAAYTAGLGLLGGAAFVENPVVGLAVGLGLSFAFGGVVDLIRRWATRCKVRSEDSAGPGEPTPAAAPPDPSPSAQRQGGAAPPAVLPDPRGDDTSHVRTSRRVRRPRPATHIRMSVRLLESASVRDRGRRAAWDLVARPGPRRPVRLVTGRRTVRAVPPRCGGTWCGASARAGDAGRDAVDLPPRQQREPHQRPVLRVEVEEVDDLGLGRSGPAGVEDVQVTVVDHRNLPGKPSTRWCSRGTTERRRQATSPTNSASDGNPRGRSRRVDRRR